MQYLYQTHVAFSKCFGCYVLRVVYVRSSQGGGGGRGRACFRCFREGHMSADCPGDSVRFCVIA